LERRVAIKVIRRDLVQDPTARERFLREARVAATLNDPRICQVYEIGESHGELFIVMELLGGESIDARLRRTPLSLSEAVPIVLDVLLALDALHARGIVHRDLKPSNIFLTEHGPKLLDFGLARQIEDAAAETRPGLTSAGAILGTPRYMAPEQWRGEPADARTDVFALGCIFYQLLAGRPPFEADSMIAAMNKILTQEPPSLGGSPGIEAADRIIQRALAHLPRSRYPSASAMADDVRSLLVYCGAETGVVPDVRAPARSVAVLPFLSAGGSADDEEFADGITEDIIAQLAKIRSIKVIGRASVLPFRDRQHTVMEIGARLGVRTLLDGRVRRAGTRVRIVTQLVEPQSGAHLWSETYDRELTDVFAIQSDVAQQIARALEAELSSDERARLGRRPTRNPAAYQWYLKGRHCLLKYTVDGIRQGVGYLQQAVAEDPEFALSHAWISLAHVITGMGYSGGSVPPRESYRLARLSAERALAVDPEVGDAHGALAFVMLVNDFDWNGSEREFKRALELSPGSDLLWAEYGLLLSALERYEETIAAYRRAKELDPLAALHSSTLASMLLRAGHVEAALDEANGLLELQPDYPMAHSTLGWAHLKLGAIDQGLAALEKAVALAPGNMMLLGQLGHACAIAGRRDQALAILARLAVPDSGRYVSPYHLAYVYAGLGQSDAAMDCLERAYEERAGGIYGVKGSFLFTGLKSHPRFAGLLRKMNLDQTLRRHDGP
jgi:eukaryotic-like serine/threonine-protein kinase